MNESENFSREEELVSLLEEMQTEIEQQKQTISNLQNRLNQSASSSEISQMRELISNLRKDNQKKSEMIVSLNERIGKLAESDNVLKLNEELKRENEKLKQDKLNAEQEAEITVRDFNQRYRQHMQELKAQKEQADKDTLAAQNYLNSSKKLIETRAKELTLEAEKQFNRRLDAFTYKVDGLIIGLFAYSFLTTIFTAIRSKAFRGDFTVFFSSIGKFLYNAFILLIEALTKLQGVCEKIPQPVIAFILSWLSVIVIFLVVLVLIFLGLYFGCMKLYDFYKDYFDVISLAEALISLAVLIYFAEPIRSVIPINLILLLLLTHVLYVLIRWLIEQHTQ